MQCDNLYENYIQGSFRYFEPCIYQSARALFSDKETQLIRNAFLLIDYFVISVLDVLKGHLIYSDLTYKLYIGTL